MKFESRRILALLLLFVTLSGLVGAFGENVLCAGEPPGAHAKAHASSLNDSGSYHDSNCPCDPSPSHSPNDHTCVGDCGSPCHAPLPSSAITLTHSRSFTYLYHVEHTRFIPEVYLSLFVPPDSAAV
jgi:hypothetical protein